MMNQIDGSQSCHLCQTTLTWVWIDGFFETQHQPPEMQNKLRILGFKYEYTLPETNSSHLKMDGWKTSSFWEDLFLGANC